MEFSIESTQNLIDTYLIPYGINLVFAIIIFIVGKWLAKSITGITAKLMKKANLDEILVNFISGIIKSILMLFVIVAALGKLGVDTTSLIALIGAAGLAVGLSLQSSQNPCFYAIRCPLLSAFGRF